MKFRLSPVAVNSREIHTPPETGALSKIDQLVADATTELKRLGINIDGKRPDQLLTMAREERNKPRVRHVGG